MIPGYGTRNTNNLRLWESKPKRGFDLQSFNAGDYERAIEASNSAAAITSVLYPNDHTSCTFWRPCTQSRVLTFTSRKGAASQAAVLLDCCVAGRHDAPLQEHGQAHLGVRRMYVHRPSLLYPV